MGSRQDLTRRGASAGTERGTGGPARSNRRWAVPAGRSPPVNDGIQGLLPDARRREDGDGKRDQAGVPQACPQVPSRRQPWRQDLRVQVQGDQRGVRGARRRRQAPQVRRARRELADVRAGAAAGTGLPRRQPVGGGGGTQDAWTINMGGRAAATAPCRPRRCRISSATRIRSPTSSARSSAAAAGETGGRARGGRATRTQKGQDIEQAVELTLEEAYHGATRRVSIKEGGHARTRRRAHSGRRQGRVARARGRRRRLRRRTAARRAISTCACR